MIYRKQNGYDAFKCIADKCPKSCCVGWQIMIDEDSIKKYKNTAGDFGARLNGSINFEEGCFKQNNTRCAMLNNNGLCDLHSTLGEDMLCHTCKMFPRHVEEFQDIREYSLSLSCPEFTRMISEPDYEFAFTESEDDVLDDPEEFEDYDFLLFDKLEYSRDKMLELAATKSISLQDRMSLIGAMGLKLQRLYDEGLIFDMDDVDFDEEFDCAGTGALLSLPYCTKSMDTLLEMEVLEESWHDSIRSAQTFWNDNSSDFVTWKTAMYPEAATEFIFEKIFESLLFTYFCGAVYDGQIYARTMIAVQSTRWLMMLSAADKNTPLNQVIYLYSREVEHSDLNVNALIEFFEGEL
ncbi:flagellin lysine-N-methylase [Pseudobutyrivibrio xylanivorans]|uniref:Lysine-N-methylase n=1 Tax=Pseudobutyrivibrio xylanivorans DSM 14809 TaxID=1123012 RepID=A0A1M6DYU7_PSEXY|nr:flagellin lysine-N-methylase [Pseudobutyrivibrio xylanivorans]SHI78432.1 lysine-N-methylase [Pseudobutyrivibrio xylanivorans DSM 14809]